MVIKQKNKILVGGYVACKCNRQTRPANMLGIIFIKKINNSIYS